MIDLTEILIGTSVEVIMLVVAAGAIYRIWGRALGLPQRNKVLPFQRGVLMNGETVDRILEPGAHWVTPNRTIFLCDTRPKPFQVTGLDLLTADHRWIRISFKGETVISEASIYTTASGDSRGAFYVDVRQAVHEFIGSQSSFVLSGDKSAVVSSLSLVLNMLATRFGLKLTHFEVWELMMFGWHSAITEADSDVPLIH